MQMLLELVLGINPVNNIAANRNVYKMLLRNQNLIFK
jgi:hypothetical protein